MNNTPTKIAGGFALAEGPVWFEEQQQLRFVDIEAGRIYSYDGSTIAHMKMPDMVGCVVPLAENRLVAAVKNKLYEVDWQADRRKLLYCFPIPEHLRFNDGKCDGAGRLWVGTMAADQSHPLAKKGGSLYCVGPQGVLVQYKGFTIPNGMAWGDNGNCLYHIDTAEDAIFAYRVINGITLCEKRTVASFAGQPGSPDGMCLDAQGNLWVALWGGGAVVCVHPATGQILHKISLPEANVSCCTFGGSKLDTLFITTAKDGDGNGGSLWKIKTNTTGILPHDYKEV